MAIDFSEITPSDLGEVAKQQSTANTSAYSYESINSNQADKTAVNKVFNEIHDKMVQNNSSVTEKETLIATCGLLQKGGTSKAMNNSSSFVFGNAKVTKQLLHDTCSKYKVTARQLARSLADQIVEISIILGLPGNQSKNFKLTHPDFAPDELCWASDFQTFNPQCPDRVRNFLVQNYVTRFSKK